MFVVSVWCCCCSIKARRVLLQYNYCTTAACEQLLHNKINQRLVISNEQVSITRIINHHQFLHLLSFTESIFPVLFSVKK